MILYRERIPDDSVTSKVQTEFYTTEDGFTKIVTDSATYFYDTNENLMGITIDEIEYKYNSDDNTFTYNGTYDNVDEDDTITYTTTTVYNKDGSFKNLSVKDENNNAIATLVKSENGDNLHGSEESLDEFSSLCTDMPISEDNIYYTVDEYKDS